MKVLILAIFIILAILPSLVFPASSRIPDTGQVSCYNKSDLARCPSAGQAFYGQDAQYAGKSPSFRDNSDGTVTDLVTGLTWSKAVDSRKITLTQAHQIAKGMTLSGHNDWRVPTIKELYSLIDFRGYTGFAGRRGIFGSVPSNAIPFINTDYFDFRYGNTNGGERYIDAQWLSSTRYVSTTMGGMATLFGVNFADGRIKGYGYMAPNGRILKLFYARYVRGEPYGNNDFVDNGDGTVTDRSSGLTWMQNDSGKPIRWQAALAYCENLNLGGKTDWRLPNAKELQYIVDYTRSPDTTGSAAIDPIFRSTAITNEAGVKDYAHYWSSTTHQDGPRPGYDAAYVAFGRALGQMRGRIMDVHGAGAQRSDPKYGHNEIGRGPQGDARRVNDFARCVRSGDVIAVASPKITTDKNSYPYRVKYPQTAAYSPPSTYQQPGMPGQGGMGNPFLDGSGSNQQPTFGQGPGGQQFGSGRQSGGNDFIQRLDRDGDNRVSRSEFDGPSNRFDYHDTNGDGYISESEAPTGPPPGMRQQRF